MLGLKRHTVRIVEHDPTWAARAEAECAALQRVTDELTVDIQHVGSTAVPGLPAKPILDIAMAVRTQDAVPILVERLTKIGYIYRGDGGDEGGHLFVRDAEPDVRLVHVHVVEHTGHQWRNYIRFRDALRQNARLREAYAQVKTDLAERCPDDRSAYTAGKAAFIQSMLNEGTG